VCVPANIWGVKDENDLENMCSPRFISTFGLEGLSFTSLITAKVELSEGFSSSPNSENSFPLFGTTLIARFC
jgi:hypothetical protein